MGHLDQHVPTILACRFCPMCRHVCTVANAVQMESTSPRGWALACYALGVGIISLEEVARSQRLFQCAACDLCYDDCVSHFQPSQAFKAARADIVESGLAPPVVQQVAHSVIASQNPFQQTPETRQRWRQNLALPQQGDVLFFAGCEIAYKRPEIAEAFIQICDAAHIKPAMLKQENCCGAPLHNLGYWQEARELALENVHAMATGSYQAVVFGCPTCQRQVTQTYRQEYQLEIPAGVEIMHTSQFVERLLATKKLELAHPLAGTVTYHDPCSLGRSGLGVYDSPRSVLQEIGLGLVEMEWNREHARCCGSATLHQTYPAIASQAASNTWAEVQRTGVDTLVTACPACKSAFIPGTGRANVRILDLVEMVAQAL